MNVALVDPSGCQDEGLRTPEMRVRCAMDALARVAGEIRDLAHNTETRDALCRRAGDLSAAALVIVIARDLVEAREVA